MVITLYGIDVNHDKIDGGVTEEMVDRNDDVQETVITLMGIDESNDSYDAFLCETKSSAVLKSISYLLAVRMTVPISQGSHIGFSSGFLELKANTLQVIILQEYAS